MSKFGDWIVDRVTRRDPDFIIGRSDGPYLRRWWVIPRNRWFNVYLHNIIRSDDDRALHDHPWWNVSIILRGGYIEVLPTRGATVTTKWRAPGCLVLRGPLSPHRLVISPFSEPVWTLFITGPRLRDWGFWCPNGWIHWRAFTSGPNGETVGLGCDASRPTPE